MEKSIIRRGKLTGIRLGDTVFRVCSKKMEQVTTPTEFSYYEQLVVDTEDIVQPDDVVMATELP
jgi:hypothetical protein